VPGATAAPIDPQAPSNYNFSFSSYLGKFNEKGYDKLAENNPAKLNSILTRNSKSSSSNYIS
jgi:hypothetical protein